MIVLSLFWKQYTEKGAITSMVVGFISVPVFKFLIPTLNTIGPYFNEIAELGPSFLLSIITGYLVSKLWPDEMLEQAVREDFRKINQS